MVAVVGLADQYILIFPKPVGYSWKARALSVLMAVRHVPLPALIAVSYPRHIPAVLVLVDKSMLMVICICMKDIFLLVED
jgi:hypothetical protein